MIMKTIRENYLAVERKPKLSTIAKHINPKSYPLKKTTMKIISVYCPVPLKMDSQKNVMVAGLSLN